MGAVIWSVGVGTSSLRNNRSLRPIRRVGDVHSHQGVSIWIAERAGIVDLNAEKSSKTFAEIKFKNTKICTNFLVRYVRDNESIIKKENSYFLFFMLVLCTV